MHIASLRTKVSVVGGIAILAVGMFPLAAGVAAADPSVTPISGGIGIQSNTARIGGSGAWTTLTGPVMVEGQIGQWPVGETISLALPANFEWNVTRITAPTVTGCDKASSIIAYSSASNLTITIAMKVGPALGTVCTVDFGSILQVRPISSVMGAGSGGTVTLTFVDPALPMPGVYPGGAGFVTMVASPPPVTTPTVILATGGTGIQSNTAATGGTGAWTSLTGPTIIEGGIGAWPIGERITLALPANFQWNQARVGPPTVTGCDKTVGPIAYSGNDAAVITLVAKSGPVQMNVCTIDFGNLLQVRPINSASSAGTGGSITLTFVDPALPTPGVFPGGAGQVSMVGTTPPPVGPLTLTITAPTMNNNAINWGEGLNITTAGSAGTVYQVQVSPTDPSAGTPAWETLTDSSAVVRNFTIGSSGTSTVTPPYTPIRNFWYRSISGTTVSNIVRITVRQTIAVRPQNTSTQTISRGRVITFTATVRPARPELQKAVVRFELYRRSGSSWVLSQTTNRTIDSNGVASWSWTASSAGSFYVRAQAQPTPVNSNSFWSPSQFYNVN